MSEFLFLLTLVLPTGVVAKAYDEALANGKLFVSGATPVENFRPASPMSQVQQSRLQFEPNHPGPGGDITITYKPETGPLQNEKNLFLVYGFTAAERAIALQRKTQLQPTNGSLRARLNLPKDAAYLWCLVRSENEREDTNDGSWWDTYLYSEDGTPVARARMERAAMIQHGKLGLENKDLRAVKLLEEELRFFSKNGRAWAELWSLRYELANRSIQAKDTILAEVRQFYKDHSGESWTYQAVALGFNRLARNGEALEVIREFVKRFPEDALMDNLVLFFLGNYGHPEDLESLSTLSKRWEDSPGYWQRLVDVYANHRVETSRIHRAGREVLARIPKDKDPGGNIRFGLAETWLRSGVDPVAAEQVAREALSISETGSRPGVVSDSREQRKILDRLLVFNINRSALGWALYHQRRYTEALLELQRAADVREKENVTAQAVYYRLGQVLEKLDRPKEAMDAYMKELAWGNYESPARTALSEVYRRFNGSTEGLEPTIKTRVNELLLKTADQYSDLVQETDSELGRFDLLDRTGQPIDLSRYHGKVVIIDFWATWCGPCLKSMEHTREIQKLFADHLVVIAPSLDPEETRSRAAEYVQKKGYDFVLVFDDERRRSVKLPFIPARLVLDQKGRLRFTEYGYAQESGLLFEKKVRSLLEKR